MCDPLIRDAKSVLVVEDDEALAGVLVRGLAEEGFRVERAGDGAAALEAARSGGFDCLVLDVMLPRLDGVEVCRRLRRDEDPVPVIMLSVRGEVADRVLGLRAGADDYVAKPFSFEELVERIRAQIRRGARGAETGIARGDLRLDPHTLTAERAGRRAELTPKEYQLLYFFVRNAGRVVAEPELLEGVWGHASRSRTNVLNVYLHRLRAKLEVEGRGPVVETIQGRGYRLADG